MIVKCRECGNKLSTTSEAWKNNKPCSNCQAPQPPPRKPSSGWNWFFGIVFILVLGAIVSDGERLTEEEREAKVAQNKQQDADRQATLVVQRQNEEIRVDIKVKKIVRYCSKYDMNAVTIRMLDDYRTISALEKSGQLDYGTKRKLKDLDYQCSLVNKGRIKALKDWIEISG